MGLKELALRCALSLAALVPSTAWAEAGLTGEWKGSYSCANQTARLTISGQGPEGIFSFEYPDGTSGSFVVGITINERSNRVQMNPVAWIKQPKDFRMIGLNGRFSDDGKTISGRATGGCNEFTIANPQAAPRPTEQARKSETGTLAGNAGGTAKAAPSASDPSDAPPVSSTWGAKLGCHGLNSIKLTFQRPDPEGWDVMIEVMEPKATEPTFLRGRTSPGRHNYGLRIDAEPATTGPLHRNPIWISVDPFRQADRLMVNIRSPNCGQTRLTPQEAGAPSRQAPLPPELAPLVGAWDGVAFEKRSDEAISISLVLRPSAANVEGRFMDADLYLNGKLQPSALMGRGERVGLLPLQRSSGSYDAALYPLVLDGGTSGDLIRGELFDRELMPMFLWRRQANETRPLSVACDQTLGPWYAAGKASAKATRDLRREFYPALTSYDWRGATAREAAALAQTLSPPQSLESFVTLCALTASDLAALPGSGFLDGVINVDELVRRRRALANGSSIANATLPVAEAQGENPIPAMERAEADLAAALATIPPQSSVSGLVSAIDSLTPLISAARPTVALNLLTPAIAELERLDRQAEAQADSDRAAKARDIMAGIGLPRIIPPGRAELLEAIASGQRRTFRQDEIGFLGGLVAGSNEECGFPTGATFLQLSGLLTQGTLLGLGTEFAAPDLLDTFRSQFAGTVNFNEGVSLAGKLSCDDPWLPAFFDALTLAASERYQTAGARAPLFDRSCSIEFSGPSCACLHRALEPLRPGIGKLAYDRQMIASVADSNPAIGAQIGLICGITNY